MIRGSCCLLLLLLTLSPLRSLAEDQPKEVRRLTGLVAPVSRISFSADGRLMLTSSNASKNNFTQHFGDCRIWNVATGELVLKLPTDPRSAVWDAKFLPNSDRIVTVGVIGFDNNWKSACFLWSMTGKKLADLSAQQVQFSRDVYVTTDGKQLVTNSYGRITIADASTGREIRRIDAIKLKDALALSAGYRLVASAVDDAKKHVQIWDFPTGRKLHETRATEYAAEQLMFSPSGNQILICVFKGAELLDCRSFKRIADLGDMRRGGFSEDSRLLVTSHWSSTIHIWDTSTGQQILQFKGHPHNDAAVAFLPDGKHVICAGGADKKDDFGQPSGAFDAYIYRLPDSILPAGEVTVAAQKLPSPSGDELNAAHEEIKQIFEADFAKAKKPEAKLELADKLFEQAAKSDSQVARYALLDEARELAMTSGGVDIVNRILNMLAEFEGDLTTTRVESVKALAVSTKSPIDLTKLTSICLTRIDQAIFDEQFDEAAELLKSASLILTKTKDSTGTLRDTIKQTQDRMTYRKKQFDEMQTAQETLTSIADNAEAHEKVGRYLCFARNDWNGGLTHLAAGADAKLKKAAMADISSPPEASKRTEVGDAWYEAAKIAKAADKPALFHRAKHWYEQAASGATGLTKIRIETRLKEIAISVKNPPSRAIQK